MAELDGTINSSQSTSFVVNLLQQHKKTPTGTKIGALKNNSSYRTIEEAKVRGSSNQPDAPRQPQISKIKQEISKQLTCVPLASYGAAGKQS